MRILFPYNSQSSDQESTPVVITVKHAAELLHVSQKTVYRWIKDGRIPYHRIGEQYCFERSDLFNFAVASRLRPVPVHPLEEDDATPVSLSESLARGGISYRVEGSSKKDVLRNALNLIRGLDQTSIAPLFDLFMAREELASTGIGNGIAIPHARGPLIGYVNAPLLSLSFLEHPVEFGALDGKPVTIMFLLITPTVRSHLHILGKLAFALRSPSFRDAILNQASREQLLECLTRVESEFSTVSISE